MFCIKNGLARNTDTDTDDMFPHSMTCGAGDCRDAVALKSEPLDEREPASETDAWRNVEMCTASMTKHDALDTICEELAAGTASDV